MTPSKKTPQAMYDELRSGDRSHSQYKHGMCRSRPYRIWRGMVNRCYRKQEVNYSRYGAKGVTVCDEWRKDFQAFWLDMGPTYFDGATIERKNNAKGYDRANCRWATAAEQNRNKASVRHFEYHGRKLTIAEVAKLGDIPHRTAYARLVRYGWNVARCIHTPVHLGNRYRA